MESLEHTIRNLLSGKQEVNEENVTIEEIIEEFYSLFEQYEEIDEETFIEVRNVYFNTLYNVLQEDDKNPSWWDLIDYVPVAGAARRLALGDYRTAGILAAADVAGALTGGAGKIALTAAAKAAAKRAATKALAKREATKEVFRTVSKAAPRTDASRTAARKFKKAADASKEAAGKLALKTGELATLAPKGTARAIANKALNPFAQGLVGGTVSSGIKYISQPTSTKTETPNTPQTQTQTPQTQPETRVPQQPKPEPQTPETRVPQQPKPEPQTPETRVPQQPKPEPQTPETRVPQQPKPEPQTPETPVPQQPKPESRKERWSDVRQRLGFSRRQSVTSDPKLLAAYNAYKERQQIAEETEYSQELIEGVPLAVAGAAGAAGAARAAAAAGALRALGAKALPNVSKFGKKAIERFKNLFKGGSKLAGTAALTAALINRLSGGLTGGGRDSGSISQPGSMTQLHIASPSSGISPTIRESESPATKARKKIENVARPKLKNLRNALGNKQGEIEKKIKE